MYAETERLRIRDLVEADTQPLHGVFGDRETTKYTNFFKANREDTRRRIDDWIFHNEQRPRFAHNCAILLKPSEELIGWTGFGHPSEVGIGDRDFGYALRRDQWNNGYMTEALTAILRFCFEELGVGSVFGECRPANPASARVMKKAGMHHTGTFPSRSEGGIIHERFIAFRSESPCRTNTAAVSR